MKGFPMMQVSALKQNGINAARKLGRMAGGAASEDEITKNAPKSDAEDPELNKLENDFFKAELEFQWYSDSLTEKELNNEQQSKLDSLRSKAVDLKSLVDERKKEL